MASSASLLGLPPELRNRVYGFVCHATAIVRLTSIGNVADHSLAAACRHLRQEFLPVWRHALKTDVHEIEATVLNYDFHHVERFLDPFARRYGEWWDGKPDDEAARTSDVSHPTQEPTVPTFSIKLKFHAPLLNVVDLSHSLGRWIQYLDSSYEGPQRSVARYHAEFDWTFYSGFAVLQLIDDSIECDCEVTCTALEDMDRILVVLRQALNKRQIERLEAVCEKARR